MKNLILFPLKYFNMFLRKISGFFHAIQHYLEWKMGATPEWYDHYLDQYYSWTKKRQPFWIERGIFSLMAIPQGANVLELCCGDGFNSKHFYSHRAKSLISVDFDKTAISHAKTFNNFAGSDFRLADIRTAIPQGSFDNIIWDAAIEHFTEIEISAILKTIKSRMTPNGILSGYTLVESEDGHKALHQHEYEFKSKEDLMRFFKPWFRNVVVVETMYPERHNLYFYASDAQVPLAPNWKHQIQQVNGV